MRLAAELAQSSLGGKVFFCNSGAEANEAAIKLARRARPGGRDRRSPRRVPRPDLRSALGDAAGEQAGAVCAARPGFRAVPADPDAIRGAVSERTAAVLVEPIQGESGVHVVPDEVLVAAREACDETGAALIFDEVQTGMGEPGRSGPTRRRPSTPDAMTVAKALGGGLPIGALVTGPRLADELGPGDHGSTFAGGPVVAAAARAALAVTDDAELLSAVQQDGALLAERLAQLDGVRERARPRTDARARPRGRRRPRSRAHALEQERLIEEVP